MYQFNDDSIVAIKERKMAMYSVAVIATKQGRTYQVVSTISASSKEEAIEEALRLAKEKCFSPEEGFTDLQATSSEIPHNMVIHYASQFLMPIFKHRKHRKHRK